MTELLGVPYVDEQWPHGLRCAECHRLITAGDRYSEKPVSIAGTIPVVRVVCVVCALAPTS